MSERDPRAQQAQEHDRISALALGYHKIVEGEYGCPGMDCPGVLRLIEFGRACAALRAPSPVAWQELEADVAEMKRLYDAAHVDDCDAYRLLAFRAIQSLVRLSALSSFPVPAPQREDEQGGTSLTEGASVSVLVPTRQLPHDATLQRVYVAGQAAEDAHSSDPVAKTVACAHASALEVLHILNERITQRLTADLNTATAMEMMILYSEATRELEALLRAGTVQELSRASVTPSASAAPSTSVSNSSGEAPHAD